MLIKSAKIILQVHNSENELEEVVISFEDVTTKNVDIKASTEAKNIFSSFSFLVKKEIEYHNDEYSLYAEIDEDIDDFDYDENFDEDFDSQI